ncbi:MAG: hypothetical protein P8I94_07475 [Emcibacteraceae bacterium]|nr:hypothetical protein [Emcibacteraceae bacterium]
MANRRPAPDGTWRIDHAKSMKDKYFSDKDANLKFGICTSSYEYFGKFAPDRVIAEMNSIHYINPDLISIHIHNHGKDFRLVPMMVEMNC